MRAALVKDGLVVNVIVIDPEIGFELPDHETVQLEDDAFCEPGATFDGKTFTRAQAAEAKAEPSTLNALLEEIKRASSDDRAALAELKTLLTAGAVAVQK